MRIGSLIRIVGHHHFACRVLSSHRHIKKFHMISLDEVYDEWRSLEKKGSINLNTEDRKSFYNPSCSSSLAVVNV